MASVKEREDKLTEWNVMQQVVNICETSFVEMAWEKKQKLTIHGWVYELADGLIRDLQVTMERKEQVREIKTQLQADRCPR
jgi:carbonic anhydrase